MALAPSAGFVAVYDRFPRNRARLGFVPERLEVKENSNNLLQQTVLRQKKNACL